MSTCPPHIRRVGVSPKDRSFSFLRIAQQRERAGNKENRDGRCKSRPGGSMNSVGLLAGSVSTALFIGSALPMLYKAGRTKNLGSYSFDNIALANLGNAVYAIYVFSMPAGPIWAMHTFYVVSSALMLFWYLRYEVSKRRERSRKLDQTGVSGLPADTRPGLSHRARPVSPLAAGPLASRDALRREAGRSHRAPHTRLPAGHPGDDHRGTSRSIVCP